MILKALQTAPDNLRSELVDLFSSTPDNSDDKVARVRQIYDQLNIRHNVEIAIDEEFSKARLHLDSIYLDDDKKQPLLNLITTLSGRKK